ncbi:MAG: FG-GAP repeat domain-containing protein [Planctomycetota bacterium]
MPWSLHIIDDSSQGADGVRLADINNDGLTDITTGWEQGAITRVYLHPGYDKVSKKWPAVTIGQTPSVEDAVFVDLDNDGAVDIISSCEGRTKKLFVNWAPVDADDYLDSGKWHTEAIAASEGQMQWMFCVPMQVDGVNGVDIIAGGKNNAQIGWFESPANPRFLGGIKYHSISNAGWTMSIILSDMDGDDDLDVVVSDRKDNIHRLQGCRWLENPGPGTAQYQQWKNHFIGGRDKEVMFMKIADLDQDGLEDVVVAVKPNSILYIRRLDGTALSWRRYEIDMPDNTGTAKAVGVGDIDKDGRKDIVFTCENAQGKYGAGWLSYKNDVTYTKWIHHDISGDERGIKYDRIELLDLDNDGDLDVLTCEELESNGGLGVIWYENPCE